jgi:hypothetical protein
MTRKIANQKELESAKAWLDKARKVMTANSDTIAASYDSGVFLLLVAVERLWIVIDRVTKEASE